MLMDHVIVRALGRVWDIILLNILWVLCSLPVVTIGVSTSALYAVTLKMVADEEGGIIKGYFKAWKDNFRQSTVIWILMVLFGCFLLADFMIFRRIPGMGNVGLIAVGIILLFYVIELIFVFPLIAVFKNTNVNMIKNAILIPVAHLPKTVFLLLLTLSCVCLTLLSEKTIFVGAVVWTLFGVATLAYVNSFLLNSIFADYYE